MMMINSPTLESDSSKHLCFSINPTKENFDDINNNHYQQDKTSSFDCNNIMKQDILSSNDTTLLTTTTTTMTTVEFKVKTTKTSSRKRKLNIINENNNDNINKQQTITKKKKKQRITKTDNDDNKKKKNNNNNSKTVDQSSVTDESSFGSCEPGTSVVLQGIVWNETDKGVLVVNITWRGKTYVGALLNTTEQNWAPPRYKSDVRSTKQNPNRDHQLTSIPSSHESTERILRNGKRRGSSTTVTPSSTTKTRSFKIPETPSSSKTDETSTTIEKLVTSSTNNHDDDETNSRNTGGGGDDEIGDNYSSRSVSPTTSGISTTSSSSPPLFNNNENQSTSIPIDLSNTKTTLNIEENTSNSIIQPSSKMKTNDTIIPYHFSNDMLFPSSTNPSDYFSSLNGSTNSFNLPSFNKLSSTSSNISPSSYLPLPSQLYFNSLTSPHYPSVSSLSKSSR